MKLLGDSSEPSRVARCLELGHTRDLSRCHCADPNEVVTDFLCHLEPPDQRNSTALEKLAMVQAALSEDSTTSPRQVNVKRIYSYGLPLRGLKQYPQGP